MKNEYFDIVQALETWLNEQLADYEYDKLTLIQKLDDPNYELAIREKEGLALAKVMLDRISKNILSSGWHESPLIQYLLSSDIIGFPAVIKLLITL